MANLTLRCAAHNALAAENDFGRELIEAKKGTMSVSARRRAPHDRPREAAVSVENVVLGKSSYGHHDVVP